MWAEKRGKTYRIRDRVGDRVVTVKTGLANKTLAKQLILTLSSDKLRGDALVHRGGEVTLAGWIDLWWPSYEASLKESAKVSSRGIVNRYIKPMLGGIELEDLDALAVQRWVADLKAGRTKVKSPRPLSRKTAANAHGLLHKILSEAVVARLIRTNPCATTKLGQKVHHEMQFLTEPEAERLLSAMPEHYRPLILLLLGTGLRWGEAVGLRVCDVDVLAGSLRVSRNLQELADTAQMVEQTPKTAAGRRTVTFTKDVALVLADLVGAKDSQEHVFLAPKGGMVRYRVFWPVFNRGRLAAGLPKVRIHDLRHTHAAWLISSNIKGGLTAIQRRLGHSSYRVTSDLYGHLLQEVDDDILTTLDARLPRLGGSMGGALRGDEIPRDTTRSVEIPGQAAVESRPLGT